MMKFKHIILLLLLSPISLSSQTKNEKESRIQLSEFPQNAQSTMHSIIEDVKRVRHYKEIDNDQVSFESKFKYKRHWYSAEFSRLGILEDVEVTIKKSDLDEDIFKTIIAYLKNTFLKHDIIKIQEQYVIDSSTDAKDFITTVFENRQAINSNYEIVIAVKTENHWELKEMTFGFKGEFLSSRHIQQGSYEYIMY